MSDNTENNPSYNQVSGKRATSDFFNVPKETDEKSFDDEYYANEQGQTDDLDNIEEALKAEEYIEDTNDSATIANEVRTSLIEQLYNQMEAVKSNYDSQLVDERNAQAVIDSDEDYLSVPVAHDVFNSGSNETNEKINDVTNNKINTTVTGTNTTKKDKKSRKEKTNKKKKDKKRKGLFGRERKPTKQDICKQNFIQACNDSNVSVVTFIKLLSYWSRLSYDTAKDVIDDLVDEEAIVIGK